MKDLKHCSSDSISCVYMSDSLSLSVSYFIIIFLWENFITKGILGNNKVNQHDNRTVSHLYGPYLNSCEQMEISKKNKLIF